MNIVDLADIVAELTVEEILFLFKTLRKDISAQLFTYLPNEVKADMISSFTSGQIKSMIETLYTDDLVDFLQDLPANVIRQILKEADHEQRTEINLLLSFPTYSAGSLMSLDFVELKAEDSVKQAITKIKRQGKDAETIQVCFVVDELRNLVGSVSLRTILFEEDDVLMKDIMDIDVIYATVYDDQERVAKLMQRYDLTVCPIVNDELRLIGIVTIDDMIDVLEDEVTEDIQKMAAIIQGFPQEWDFFGRKTPAYRQVGNAFPPPVARAVGESIRHALSELPVEHSRDGEELRQIEFKF
jgi:magnesium transporter